MPAAFSGLRFDNSYARLPDVFYTAVAPQALARPRLAAYSGAAAGLLELPFAPSEGMDFARLLGGESVLEGMQPLAMVYAGHQFGSYNPRLGDGRGLLLGEVVNGRGERWDLHLKGAGLTPYSRHGDGRAVLRSCIREFLASEALAALGIPTTRALAVAVSDTPVYRETAEPGATLLRLAQSHVRFGHFEYFAHTGQVDALRRLADYVVDRHYPEAREADVPLGAFFAEVVRRTACLVARWQAEGFTHGVMNTDNMSILGETLDYGPYGFLDSYEAGYVPNHSDTSGRYAFDQQPSIALWNCWCLARALRPLLDKAELESGLAGFEPEFVAEYSARLRRKFGLAREEEGDRELILDALALLENQTVDYSLFMRRLARVDEDINALLALCAEPQGWHSWLARYRERLARDGREAQARRADMEAVNPAYILRKHLAQEAIAAAEQGDYSGIARLHAVLRNPYVEQAGAEHYSALPPAWSRELCISCSS
ncbi:MAG: YdiU family protein [Gammaproteobacteria bacterium]|nr:YdiU family protein [Gammaproteobacteria bacterium]